MPNNTNPNINFALVDELPENIERGTIYLSSQEHGGFIKIGKDASTADTIYEGGDTLFEPGTGNNSIQQKDTSCLAIGERAVAIGSNTTAMGEAAYAEGKGTYAESSFTISGAANSSTYTSNSATGFVYGSIVEYNGIIAKVVSINSNTKFSLDKTLSAEEALSNVHINVCTGISYGNYAHADGWNTTAVGTASHAEGNLTITYGDYAHAEGNGASASASASHSEGYKTLTRNPSEHAQGQFNKSNKVNGTFGNAGNTLHSIGIGTNENTRSNAIEVMQNADTYIKGVAGYDGTNPLGTNSIQSKFSSIDSSIASISGVLDVSTADNGKILMVVAGQWTLVNPVILYSGSGEPSDTNGNNGDLYMQTS